MILDPKDLDLTFHFIFGGMFISNYFLGEKNKWAFIWLFILESITIILGFITGLTSLIVWGSAFAVMHIRNYSKWST